jgi:hypothetical protein
MGRSRACQAYGLAIPVLVALLLVTPPPLKAQSWIDKGYQMSAMSFDSLGFRVVIDDEGSRLPESFQRLLIEDCMQLLERNGVHSVVVGLDARETRRPSLVVDLTVTPIFAGSRGTEELYYGTLSFQREVSVMIADRPWKAIGSTWSVSFGGEAASRLAIVSDVEARLTDFLGDYLKLNSARWIWRQSP